MSVYTMQLRYIVENATQNIPNLSIQERINQGKSNVFDFSYPWWNIVLSDVDSKEYFEDLFIKQYYQREIGAETPAQFKLWLETFLRKRMPYYISLHETLEREYDWLTDVDLYTDTKDDTTQVDKTEFTGESKTDSSTNISADESLTGSSKTEDASSSKNNTENTNENDRLVSGMPQHTVSVNNLNQGQYGREYIKDVGKDASIMSGETTGETLQNTTSENVRKQDQISDTDVKSNSNTGYSSDKERELNSHIHGKSPGITYMDMVAKYRENIINIITDLIDELDELFLQIW